MIKRLRGSKLDAETRAKYQSDVAQAHTWDTSTWPKWTVTGRVLPERCDVNIASRLSQGVSAGGRFQLKLTVDRSHIVALCAVEKASPTIFEIADVVRTAVSFPIDYIAFLNRGAYETVLDLCINNQTGEVSVIPIFEPVFETKDEGLCFDPASDKTNIIIPWAAAAVPELPTALHDLTAAVRYPRRTFEHCRMAVEVMRRHFDPTNIRGHRERQIAGEVNTSAALHVTRKSLLALDALAARSRHGELVVSINWELRKRALEFAWELVARFISHLQGNPNDGWKLLDVKFEE